jgi:hydroxysqualene dehydroxylase
MLKHTHTPRNVAIVGAGLAGLAAAHTLLCSGHQVTMFEAAPQAGGRARGVPHAETMLDNGQHLCIGAYQATLALLRQAGLNHEHLFTRLPLALHMHHGAQCMLLVVFVCLLVPLYLLWGLLTAHGLSFNSKWQAIRWMLSLKRCAFTLVQDTTVESLLQQGQQTETAIKTLWEPLCLAALNTPIQIASAQVFLNVLRDSFQQQRADSDFLILKLDLSSSLIEPLLEKVTILGGKVSLRTPVISVKSGNANCVLETSDSTQSFDDVILAVGPHQLKTVTTEITAPVFDYQPITTVYLQYSAHFRLPYSVMGLYGGMAQWVFDRGQCCQQAGLLAVVISAHGPFTGDKTALIQQCLSELNQALASHDIQLEAAPLWTQVITEKRATFSCTPDLPRPQNNTSQPHIYLAGDYTAGPYPATIEGAVRSGVAAASLILTKA